MNKHKKLMLVGLLMIGSSIYSMEVDKASPAGDNVVEEGQQTEKRAERAETPPVDGDQQDGDGAAVTSVVPVVADLDVDKLPAGGQDGDENKSESGDDEGGSKFDEDQSPRGVDPKEYTPSHEFVPSFIKNAERRHNAQSWSTYLSQCVFGTSRKVAPYKTTDLAVFLTDGSLKQAICGQFISKNSQPSERIQWLRTLPLIKLFVMSDEQILARAKAQADLLAHQLRAKSRRELCEIYATYDAENADRFIVEYQDKATLYESKNLSEEAKQALAEEAKQALEKRCGKDFDTKYACHATTINKMARLYNLRNVTTSIKAKRARAEQYIAETGNGVVLASDQEFETAMENVPSQEYKQNRFMRWWKYNPAFKAAKAKKNVEFTQEGSLEGTKARKYSEDMLALHKKIVCFDKAVVDLMNADKAYAECDKSVQHVFATPTKQQLSQRESLGLQRGEKQEYVATFLLDNDFVSAFSDFDQQDMRTCSSVWSQCHKQATSYDSDEDTEL